MASRIPPPTMPPRDGARMGARSQSTWSVPTPTEAEMENFARQDDGKAWTKKTLSRAFVESTLQHMKWYNPQKGTPGAPSLSKAWAYYEHITLARHFVGDQTSDDNALQRAEPGETSDTELYDPWTTPESALNEWGIGVGMYFSMVRAVALIFLLTALINVPNIMYYRSPTYNGDGGQAGVSPFTLQGSAVCTNRSWVVCANCTKEQWNTKAAESRFGTWTDPENPDTTVTFVQRTMCKGAELPQGMVNYASVIFLIVALGLLALYQRKREVRFDEDKSTSTDYSIKISNPPPDAYDPDKWRDFFEQFASKQVTFVTVALNNRELLWALFLRRLFIDKLRRRLPEGTDMDDKEEVEREVEAYVVVRESRKSGFFEKLFFFFVVPFLRPFNFFLDAEVLVERIKLWTGKVKEAQKKKYTVTQVYVTFETEEGQRAAMAALKCSKLDLWRQNKDAVDPTALFQGRLLKVSEPAEPNSVRWLDLQVTIFTKVILRLGTLLIVFGLIALSGFAINRARNLSALFYGVCVAVFNFLIPIVAKLLMILERHSNEGSVQNSMYIKITIFRWVNTALLTMIVTPFTSTIGDGTRELLPSINAILLSEMIVAPLLRVLDIVGNFRKHILAPRSTTQLMMNLNFTGTVYNLGERYTDFTKVVFLVFFYSSINPNTFFIGFGTLLIQYYVDKFCLMRIWTSAPFIGTELAVFSRRYFLSTALMVMAVVSSYLWASFPYDNVCDPIDPTGGFEGLYENVKIGDGTTKNLFIQSDEEVVFCQQGSWELPGINFPAVPENLQGQSQGEWMTPSQKTLTSIYGWSSMVALIVWIVVVFGGLIVNSILSLFQGSYSPATRDNKIDFSTVQEIFAYVPQIRDFAFPFPMLACDVDNIDQNLIGWNDPHHSYDYHNMIYDVPWPGMKRKKKILENTRATMNIADHTDYEVENRGLVVAHSNRGEEGEGVELNAGGTPLFSIVKHWPPEWKQSSSVASPTRVVGV